MSASVKSAGATHASQGNLTASVGKNTAYGIIASLFQVGTRLVTIPIVIYHLGLAGYGIWSIIMTAAMYMRFGSSGIKSAFQKYVAEATGNEDYDAASRLLSTGSAAMAIVSVAGLVPVMIFSRPLARAAGVPPRFLHDAAMAFSVLALTMLFANSAAAYEGIVLGGHRIDVARKINTILTVAEAAAIITVLHFGYGLFAMSCVMAASELIYLICCYAMAHRIVPQIHVAVKYLTTTVWRELLTYTGSYQLVSMLETIYAVLISVVVLRAFGADSAGVYAVANRLVQPVGLCQNAFLIPILSSGAMVCAAGQSDRVRRLVSKSFKVTLALALTPLALIAIFGPYIVEAWTGSTDASFHYAIWLICLASFFGQVSSVALILYRAAGGALMDMIRQIFRVAALVPFLFISHSLGFERVLAWIVVVEFVAMVLMLISLAKSLHVFTARLVMPDFLRLLVATAAVMAIAALAAHAFSGMDFSSRMLAAVKAGAACLAALIVAYPVYSLTGAVTGSEIASILRVVRGSKSANAAIQ
ncbi:MAG TPA: oligosaccharide flippase family protein [Candidatus Dormibacteraeota bacterium]|nr:oligosaccharide flippase family protein [Candidatus Dormibacteraeota bacterium]